MRQLSSQSLFLLIFFFAAFARADYVYGKTAIVDKFLDDQKVTAISESSEWEVGEILPVISQNSKLGVIAFIELNSIKPVGSKKFELRAKLIRQSRRYFIQSGDIIRRMDLTMESEDYIGSTDLIIQKSHMNISSRYRPLIYMGFAIGVTAQTLYEREFLVNYLGNLYYGYNDWLTLGTFTTANFLGRPNAEFKARLLNTESTTLSSGLSFVKLIPEKEQSINLNLYWDNISSDALITHTFISIGLVKWENAGEAAAIKALGSSSFQTGYEIITDDWNRFLLGPSYNFERKALGGYLSYIWIWDRFHAQVSVNATDITHLRFDPTDGYYGFFDLFWRF